MGMAKRAKFWVQFWHVIIWNTLLGWPSGQHFG